jgi:hypothetical protein
MAIVSETREIVYPENWRVAICDQCGKRQDVGRAEGLPVNIRSLDLPLPWVSVFQAHETRLVFCSTECLKAYH